MQLLSASDLALYFGDRLIFSDVGFEVQGNSRIGIVGPNGVGKTSLARLILGDLDPDSGSIERSRSLRLGYVPQTAEATGDGTLRDEVMVSFQELRRLEEALADNGDAQGGPGDEERRATQARYTDLLDTYESLGGYEYEHLAERTAFRVGLTHAALDTPAALASGGERTRAGLARALLSDPDLLLLDEPTNYLDFQALDWLEKYLSTTKRAFIVISHDRYFLDRVTTETWEMANGRLTAYPGGYSRYKALKEEAQTRQIRERERQQVFIAKERAYIERNRAGQNAKQARGRETRLKRLSTIDAPETEQTVRLARNTKVTRAGDVVLTLKGLRVGVEDNEGTPRELVAVPDLEVRRGARVGVIGPNGAGKTTLVRTVLGLAPPMAGKAVLGHKVTAGYLQQDLDDLPEEASVMEALRAVRRMTPEEARGYLARFLFLGDDIDKQVSVLSGGERTRLSLARLLITSPNLVVLDEPTTHLDIPSREALEQVLEGYEGTLLFVSHDRRFVSLLAEQLWVLQDGAFMVFDGGFEAWAQSASKPQLAQPAKAANRREQRRERAAKARPDPKEKAITMLEVRSVELHTLLEEASARADMAAITELSAEYNQVQEEMERAWAAWAE